MKKLIYLSLIIFCSACHINKPRQGEDLPYEIPPRAPVPPITICYELRQGTKGQDLTTLKLTIQTDSVHGVYDYMPAEKDKAHGTLSGIEYGTVLFVTYRSNSEGMAQSEDQEWSLSGDSIYRKISKLTTQDSAYSNVQSGPDEIFMPALRKVKCK